MSEEIIKVLEALSEKFGIAIDWTSENVIPYLKQLCGKYVNYEITTSVIWLVIGIALLFIGMWGIKKTKYCFNKSQEYDYSDWGIGAFFVGLGTGIAFLMGVTVIVHQIFDIVTCLTFPEKIIIDQLESIYTSMN